MERNIERIYEAWENLLQGIRNNNDIERVQRIFNITQNNFYTEYNMKQQFLEAYETQNEEELKQKTQKFETFQIRAFNSWKAGKKLLSIYYKFCQKAYETFDRFQNIFINLQEQQQYNDQQNGLSQRIIRRFQVFTADETHVGDQCCICMEKIDVGRRMRRLTCDGQHYFCQECIEGWFAEHNTCPLCRHKFD